MFIVNLKTKIVELEQILNFLFTKLWERITTSPKFLILFSNIIERIDNGLKKKQILIISEWLSKPRHDSYKKFVINQNYQKKFLI